MEKGRGDRGEEGRDFFGVFFCLRLDLHESLLLIPLKKNAKGFLNWSLIETYVSIKYAIKEAWLP